jgi:hypothetical protein
MSAQTNIPKAPVSKPGVLETEIAATVRRHLRIGWWSILVFLTLGVALEALHGFKTPWYLNVSNSTRRLMFTLAHAHGTLLGVLHVAFAATVPQLSGWDTRQRVLASNSLFGAGILIPAGFFLGGLVVYAGDPGLGIILVPVGALLLFVAVFMTARAAGASKPASTPAPTAPSLAKR